MIPMPNPNFPHLARALRARMWARTRLHLSEHFPWPLAFIVVLTGLTIGLCL